MDEDVWVSIVSRGGRMVQVRGSTSLRVGDEVLALASDGALAAGLFRAEH